MISIDQKEMARNLRHLGVAAGQEDAIAHELVERFGWRKLEGGRVTTQRAGHVVVEPGAVVVQQARDPRQRAEYLAASLAEQRMGNAR